jgi:hypothetical protein
MTAGDRALTHHRLRRRSRAAECPSGTPSSPGRGSATTTARGSPVRGPGGPTGRLGRPSERRRTDPRGGNAQQIREHGPRVRESRRRSLRGPRAASVRRGTACPSGEAWMPSGPSPRPPTIPSSRSPGPGAARGFTPNPPSAGYYAANAALTGLWPGERPFTATAGASGDLAGIDMTVVRGPGSALRRVCEGPGLRGAGSARSRVCAARWVCAARGCALRDPLASARTRTADRVNRC